MSKKNSVLIIDDDSMNISALNHILGADYTVYAAKTGDDAIRAAMGKTPDIILLDIVMPDMDGYMIMTMLKAIEITKNIPVIFITSLTDADDEQKGLSLGAADYIFKPFSPAVVKLRVENHLKIINQTRLIIEKEINEKSSREHFEFFANMSNSLLDPLNIIIGMSQIALMPMTGDDKRKECLIDINKSANDLLKMLQKLLKVADAETAHETSGGLI